MPLAEKSRIIVLHQTKYSDSSLIVHAVDSGRGRRSFLLRGVAKGRGRSRMSDFQALGVLDIISYESSKSSLSYIREWEQVVPASQIRSNIYKSTVAMFIAEVLYRSFRTEDADPGFFEWLCGAIAALEEAEGSIANFHLWFMASYCTRMGFEPAEGFEPKAIFEPRELELLEKIMKSPMEETLALPLNAQRRRAFSRKMLQYLGYHLGCEISARSLDVLHEIFS